MMDVCRGHFQHFADKFTSFWSGKQTKDVKMKWKKVSDKPEGKPGPEKTEREVSPGHVPLITSPATLQVQLAHNSSQSFRVPSISRPAWASDF